MRYKDTRHTAATAMSGCLFNIHRLMKNSFLLCCFAAASLVSAAKAPDFSFPETVITEATGQLSKAQHAGDSQDMIDAIVKISIAKTHISGDFMPEAIAMVDSTAKASPDRVAKSLLYSLEADMYLALYNNNRRVFATRDELADTVPADVTEWSRGNFVDKIIELSDSSLAAKEMLSATPVDKYKRIITLPKAGNEAVPTLFDMLAYHALDNVESISAVPPMPLRAMAGSKTFLDSRAKYDDRTAAFIDRTYRALLETNKNDTPAFIYAELHRLANTFNRITGDYSKCKEKYASCLDSLYSQFADSPYSVEILARKADYRFNKADYEEAKLCVARYGKYDRIGELKNIISRYEQQTVMLQYGECFTSTDSIEVSVNSRNVSGITIKTYKIPESINLTGNIIKLLPKFKLVRSADYKVNYIEGNNDTTTVVKCPPLGYGRYVMIPEFKDSKTGKTVTSKNIYSDIMRVTDLTLIMTTINNENRIYAVNSVYGNPIEKARLHFTDGSAQRTNRYGYAVISNSKKNLNVYATYGNDRSTDEHFYSRDNTPRDNSRNAAKIVTDLGVYRPGDTMRFAAIVYNTGKASKPIANLTVKAVVSDANRKEIASIDLLTDAFGRVDSLVTLPTGGLTGRFTISIKEAANGRTIDSSTFMVSEYKAPTFYVELDEKQSEFSNTDSLIAKGRVLTFSQFPLANVKIDYSIAPEYAYWWTNTEDNGNAEGTVTTDSNGYWTISIPEDIFGNPDKKRGMFRLSINATSENGETQPFETTIKIGNARILQFGDNQEIENAILAEASGTTRINFTVTDYNNEKLSVDCHYRLTDENGKTIAEGTVNSGNPVFDFSTVKSGKYILRMSIPGEDDRQTERETIIYRTGDTEPPYSTLLWTTVEEVKCDTEGNFSFTLGSSNDTFVYSIVTNSDGEIINEGWRPFMKGIRVFEGKALIPKDGEAKIELLAIRNHKVYNKVIALIPAVPADTMRIVTETFRDNIAPGSRETWKLRLSGNNGQKYVGAMIADMYDAALNKIQGNTYNSYIIRSFSHDPFSYSYQQPYYYISSTSASTTYKALSVPSFTMPYLNMYGQSFYNTVFAQAEVMRTKSLNSAFGSAPTYNSTKQDAVSDSGAMLEESLVVSTTAQTEEATSDKNSYRDPDVKNAFFMPALVSDNDGVVTIEFTVPDRNTQWQFTAIAYTADMKTDAVNRLITANKPLMVQPNLPRFVRTGDKVELKATVMNNSGNPSDATVTVEIFDPATGKISSTYNYDCNLAANGSETVSTTLDAKGFKGEIGYRIKAANEEYSDGEQSLITILPATTEVVEAVPFFLTENQKETKIDVPKFGTSGTITVEYCDNPVWYVVTALPSIMSESQTASALVNNYYVTAIGSAIVNGDRQVSEAIKQWNAANRQKSNLQKNSELKTVGLEDSPWLRAAESETEMMDKLIELTDSATIQYRLQKSLTSLRDLQNADGGFTWIKGNESSEFTTWNVLSRFGYLKEAGYLDAFDPLLNDIVEHATEYADSMMIANIQKAENPETVYPRYSEYIFIRSMLVGNNMPNELIMAARDSIVDRTKKHWGKFTIEDKAEAAILLANYGEKAEAVKIVESLRQYARKSTAGYYWDVDNCDKVKLAATALKAFYKVNPADPDIDNIRRWILLSKETLNWGATPAACDAVNAVLATGSDWKNSDRRKPEIKFGKEKISTGDADAYFGYVKQTVTDGKGKNLTVKRHGDNPAWSAVYYRYEAPMATVEKASSPDIRIEKTFYRYGKDGKLESIPVTNFKIGDRLQVRIVIKTARDLDYVALTDDRAAIFEPVDQLPVYEYAEGTRYLRETRDSATNIFFNRLTKGTRVITYDVFVNNAGTCSSGIATLQCQYAPQQVAHTAGTTVTAQ